MHRPPLACKSSSRRRASDRGAKSSAGSAKGGCKSTAKSRRSAPGCPRPTASRSTGVRYACTPRSSRNCTCCCFTARPARRSICRRRLRAPQSTLNLPRSSGRWLAIQPMPPVDGGLEILTDDGSWAHRVSQGVHALTVDYVLRMRGPLTEALVEEFRAATDCEGEAMTVLRAEAKVRRGLQSLAERHRARDALGAGAPLVGGARHHRQPADARAIRAGAPIARFAPRAFTRHVGERTQRVDQRNRCREGRLRSAKVAGGRGSRGWASASDGRP